MGFPRVRTERQKRAITALAKRGKISTYDLRDVVGQQNIPELMAGLARNGWCWYCERVEMLDRDGKSCRPGVYELSPSSKKIAEELVEVWEATTPQTQAI